MKCRGGVFIALVVAVVVVEANLSTSERLKQALEEEQQQQEEENRGDVWAVLVAGSNGWYNYRHQVRTEVCQSHLTL